MMRQIWQRLAQQQPAAASNFLLASLQPLVTPSAFLFNSASSRTSMQQLMLLQAVWQQHSYSTWALTEQQQTSEVQQLQKRKKQPGKQQQQQQPFFWNNLSSKIPSRKPAIKRPARHQWHYCNPAYDPMLRKPQQYLPPYAPARAHGKDYRAIMMDGMPKHNRNRYRRMWAKNMAIADQRWRQNWESTLAAKRKAEAKLRRMTERIIRQRSWQAWNAEQAAAATAAVAAPAASGEL